MTTGNNNTSPAINLCSVPEAIREIAKGKILAIVEDANAPGAGALAIASACPAPSTLTLMASITRGLVSMATLNHSSSAPTLPDSLVRRCKVGASYPSSATDGMDAIACEQDLMCIVPSHPTPKGVLQKPGYAECAADLGRAGGAGGSCFFSAFTPSPESRAPSSLWEVLHAYVLKTVSIADVIRFRMTTETHLSQRGSLPVRSRYGYFDFLRFDSDIFPPVGVLVKGAPGDFRQRPPLVRIEAVYMSDGMCTSPINCLGLPLEHTLDLMYHDGNGIVIFLPSLRHRSFEELAERSGMRLFEEDPFQTLDSGWYSGTLAAAICAQVLRHLHAEQVRLISNKPQRLSELEASGIRILCSVSSDD